MDASATLRSRAAFAAILAAAMAASTFSLAVLAVLSGELLDEFSMARWQLGLVVTSIAVVGAAVSPALGRASDRIGGRRALLATFGASAVSLSALAVAPAYGWLLVAGLVAGLAQGAANPATNKLVSAHLDAGGRGFVTGVKQSGVQVGVSLAGLLLPVGAVALGWRGAVGLAALVPAAGLALTPLVVPPDGAPGPQDRRAGPDGAARDPYVLWLAAYGFLLGAGWSGAFTYLPDYARAAVGFTVESAGALVTVAGVLGVAGRIGWSWLAEHRWGSPVVLVVLAVLAVAATGLVAAATSLAALLWLGAGLLGLTAGAWNAVGMLAVIEALPTRSAGRGSGTVLFGFLTGLAAGAPVFGWSVDQTSAYAAGLTGTAVLFVLGALAAHRLRAVEPMVAVASPAAARRSGG